MYEHTIGITQNLIDFLATVRYSELRNVETRFIEKLVESGVSTDDALEAVENATMELHSRCSNLCSPEFKS
jgi:hypothetical protein